MVQSGTKKSGHFSGQNGCTKGWKPPNKNSGSINQQKIISQSTLVLKRKVKGYAYTCTLGALSFPLCYEEIGRANRSQSDVKVARLENNLHPLFNVQEV